jgi:hypothetical protein
MKLKKMKMITLKKRCENVRVVKEQDMIYEIGKF